MWWEAWRSWRRICGSANTTASRCTRTAFGFLRKRMIRMGLLDSEKRFKEALRDARRIARSLDGLSDGLRMCEMRDVALCLNMAVWNLSKGEEIDLGRVKKFQRAMFDVV